MSTQPASQLVQIEVSAEQRRQEILTNTIKMLTNRGILNQKDIDTIIKKTLDIQSDDMVYKINLPDKNKLESKQFIIKIINQKITAINKSSGISDFLNAYKNDPKILIVNSISNKARSQATNNYPKTEVFLEKELMINLIEKIEIPLHILLSDEEGNKILEVYNVAKRGMPKISNTDPVAKYYNMKIGQVCKIIRPSETSGKVPYYRLVVKAPSIAKG